MDFSNKNLYDFINYIITYDTVDDILESCKNQSEKVYCIIL